MFGLFKKKNKEKPRPSLMDLDKKPIGPGDTVQSLRYNLGKCKILEEEGHYYYQSLESGEKVSWLKMIDAATEMQKVKKLGS
mgnify:CR=1 FL=1